MAKIERAQQLFLKHLKEKFDYPSSLKKGRINSPHPPLVRSWRR